MSHDNFWAKPVSRAMSFAVSNSPRNHTLFCGATGRNGLSSQMLISLSSHFTSFCRLFVSSTFLPPFLTSLSFFHFMSQTPTTFGVSKGSRHNRFELVNHKARIILCFFRPTFSMFYPGVYPGATLCSATLAAIEYSVWDSQLANI